MTYEQFKEEVMGNIISYLPEEYEDYEMEIQTIQKSGFEYEGLLIRPVKQSGSIITPVLNLNNAYERYQRGTDMEEILTSLAKVRTDANIPGFRNEDILIFDKVKSKIYPRLVNTASNKEYLKGKLSTKMADLSIMYVVRVSETKDGFSDAVI